MTKYYRHAETMERCKRYVLSILKYEDNIKHVLPERLYVGVSDLAQAVAVKMRTFGDALTGKANPFGSSMQMQHFNLVQHMRLNEPEKYKQLVYFSTIYPTFTYEERKKHLISFFQKF
jgi:hypothetical protein